MSAGKCDEALEFNSSLIGGCFFTKSSLFSEFLRSVNIYLVRGPKSLPSGDFGSFLLFFRDPSRSKLR